MGLIKAATGAVSQVLGDQFKEFVTCPTTDKNVLIVRGEVNHGEGNKNFTEGVISRGSKIIVPQGFAMMIVDNGAIKEFTADPGEFEYDSSTEPSVFAGNFGENLLDSIKRIGSRITYGGAAARDQRVYYINTLNITGNKFGSAAPEIIQDPIYGSVEVTYFGEYSFRVVDPAVLIAQVIGANAADTVSVDEVVGGQLKLQFASNVSTCISDLMTKNQVAFNTINSYKNDVVKIMNDLLDESWKQQYGLEVLDVAININASEESKAIIREVDSQIAKEKRRGAMYSENPQGLMAAATAEAMTSAAKNEGGGAGAAMAFMGMNMAGMTGSTAMGAAQNMQPAAAPAEGAAAPAGAKFCPNCGTPTTGSNFCANCGQKLN